MTSEMKLHVEPGMMFEELRIETLFQCRQRVDTFRQGKVAEETANMGCSHHQLPGLCEKEPTIKPEAPLENPAAELAKRHDRIRKLYSERAKNKEWRKKAKDCALWSFELASSTKELGTMVVFSHPIYKRQGTCSRSTQCYLGLSISSFSSNNFNEWGDEMIVKELRTIKTSWQDQSRTREGEFYRLYEERCSSRSGEGTQGLKPIQLAKVLASGDISHPPSIGDDEGRKIDGISETSPISPQSDETEKQESTETHISSNEDENNPLCSLHWLVFEQVGYPLRSFPSTTCLLESLLAALNAHEACLKEGILHRDISVNNILLNITDNSGFLIDLDVAKDLKDTQGINCPSRTGTIMFMSSVLGRGMLIHRPWYDLESFFWVLVFLILRHGRDITFDGTALRNDRSRQEILNFVFNEGEDPFDSVSRSKRGFLCVNLIMRIPHDKNLHYAFVNIKESFTSLYLVFEAIEAMIENCNELATILDPTFTPDPDSKPKHAECSGKEDLLAIISSIRERGKITTQELQAKEPTIKNLARLLERLNKIDLNLQISINNLCFPTHEGLRRIFEEAIQEPTSNSAAIPYIPPEGPEPTTILHSVATIMSNAIGKSSQIPRASLSNQASAPRGGGSKRKSLHQEDSPQNNESNIDSRSTKRLKTENRSQNRSRSRKRPNA